MKSGPPQTNERRGLFCSCGASLDTRLVAKSYPSPSGQFRTRFCGACHTEIETVETVLGNTSTILDVTGLDQGQIRIIRDMTAQFRRQNSVIDMPHARVPQLKELASA